MPSFVAFLRGINVSGNKIIPMKSLAALFEKAGFANVRTVLASGNVLFDAKQTSAAALSSAIETAIEKKFGFRVGVQVRRLEEIVNGVNENPFKPLTPNDTTYLCVTFLNRPDVKLPDNPGPGVRFLSIRKQMLFSVLDRKRAKSTDFMSYLDKTYSKDVTTRNWNTLLKIAAAAG